MEPTDQPALDDLIALLDLERIEVNIFRGQSPDENRQRVFGGQVAGQALVAAGRTVQESVRPGEPERHVHSLHAYFLRPGDPTTPIIYEVDRIRDGRSFTTRRVNAIQHGKAIFTLSASFQVAEEGLDHAAAIPPGLPDPEGLPDFKTRMEPYKEQMGDWYSRPRTIDLRFIDPVENSPTQRLWFRADGKLTDDALLHVCVVTYASDMTLLDSIFSAHDLKWEDGNIMGASLDHAMWFHRPFRADEWMLYDQFSPSASGARGLAEGRIFTQDGRLAVSVVQEGLVRVINR
ncbi:MAG: acyl-CoA thioesterase [Actinomycetota bacterium]|jgi:acyl-CoA thioesterase-2